MSDNKALADRLEIAAKIHEDIGGQSALAATIREAAAALSPQADKARGEVWEVAETWLHERVAEVKLQRRRRPDETGPPEFAGHLVTITTPQPQGDGFTAADMMDARAEERSRLSGSQVSGGGEVTVSAKEISILRTFFPDATTHELTDAVIAVKHEAALSTPQARDEDSTDYECLDCGKLNYKPLRCQNCGLDPEQARPWVSLFGSCVCEGYNACPGCNPNEAIAMARELATADERRKHPPCLECGATSAKDAETKCHCSGDKDDCHGCQLWPDGDTPQARPDGGAVVARGVISEATDGWLDCVELTEVGAKLPPGEYQFYTHPTPAPDVALPQAFSDIRHWMEHCVSAAEEGVDYCVPRNVLDALTSLRMMEKIGRNRWSPTPIGEEVASYAPLTAAQHQGATNGQE